MSPLSERDLRPELKILHVEVGGTYGGSLRALELYLAHRSRQCVDHDVLFYYPTPNAERLAPYVGKLSNLYSKVPAWLSVIPPTQNKPRRKALRHLGRLPGVAAARNWVSTIAQLPIAFRLAQFIRHGEYDLVHINNTFTYQVPTLLAARFSGIPVIAHVRNPITNEQFTRFLVRQVNCLVSVADVHSAYLRNIEPSLRVVTCRDALGPVSVESQSRQALRCSLVRDGEILVGSLGRLVPSKGFEFFVRAASLVVAEVPNVKFVIAGEGPQRQQLENFTITLGLQNRFQLIGFRSDSASFLAALDIFVCPSLWEGGPLTVLEAMQLAKPVISTGVGIVPEVIEDGRNGLLVPTRDPFRLKDAIVELSRDVGLRERLGNEGLEAIELFCDLEARARDLDLAFLSTARACTKNYSIPMY
ncbi:MAG: glycosyltransferase family 4 protein [Candidatus Acidiferrum sp.]